MTRIECGKIQPCDVISIEKDELLLGFTVNVEQLCKIDLTICKIREKYNELRNREYKILEEIVELIRKTLNIDSNVTLSPTAVKNVEVSSNPNRVCIIFENVSRLSNDVGYIDSNVEICIYEVLHEDAYHKLTSLVHELSKVREEIVKIKYEYIDAVKNVLNKLKPVLELRQD